jgi:hypothetical protein
MTDLHCPLCGAVLSFPPGLAEPQQTLSVLEEHFGDSCTAIRVPRAVARAPEHHRDKHDGE